MCPHTTPQTAFHNLRRPARIRGTNPGLAHPGIQAREHKCERVQRIPEIQLKFLPRRQRRSFTAVQRQKIRHHSQDSLLLLLLELLLGGFLSRRSVPAVRVLRLPGLRLLCPGPLRCALLLAGRLRRHDRRHQQRQQKRAPAHECPCKGRTSAAKPWDSVEEIASRHGH